MTAIVLSRFSRSFSRISERRQVRRFEMHTEVQKYSAYNYIVPCMSTPTWTRECRRGAVVGMGRIVCYLDEVGSAAAAQSYGSEETLQGGA